MTDKKKTSFGLAIVSVMLCFFAMGFVDLIGTANNFVKSDFGLSDSMANFMTSTMLFLMFLVFSVPSGLLMNKIGRKKTVLASLVVTLVAMVLPVVDYSLPSIVVFSVLLGIGNAMLQTALNPLLSSLVSGDKLASSITFGQFVKAIASFLAPIIASWGAKMTTSLFGLEWRILFPIYFVIGILATLLLLASHIEEEKTDGKVSGFMECMGLLKKPFVLLCFFGIVCHVGIDVGTNMTAPKVLVERFGLCLNEAMGATAVYFFCRTVGSFLGAFLLRVFSNKTFLGLSVVIMLVALAGMMVLDSQAAIYTCIGLIGFGNSNVFSIIFAEALSSEPDYQNEVSGLLIMGLIGGAIFPILMGLASDGMGSQNGALAVMVAGVAFLFVYFMLLKSPKKAK